MFEDFDFDAPIAADKLADLIQIEIDKLQAGIDAHEERLAIQFASIDDGKTTTERAIDALKRPERFAGEHQVASAWLRENADRIWSGK